MTSAKSAGSSPTQKRQSGAPASSAKVSEYVKFVQETVHRRQLKGAPYNPRKLSPKARARLKANIEKVGFLEPPIWNKRSGNVVGGHQRLSILDALHGGRDYLVPVVVVDLDEQAEKEQNVALNNPALQGEFDLPKLEALFRKDKIGVERAGFDEAEILNLFGAVPDGRSDILASLGGKLQAFQEIKKKVGQLAVFDGIKDDCEFYRVLVFASDAEADAFSADRFVNGRELAARLAEAEHGGQDRQAKEPSAGAV